jgi:hypothetical protein
MEQPSLTAPLGLGLDDAIKSFMDCIGLGSSPEDPPRQIDADLIQFQVFVSFHRAFSMYTIRVLCT